MKSAIRSLTFDCANPTRQAEFWAAVLGYKVQEVDEEVAASMYETAVELTRDAGYEQYEISNFACVGLECLSSQRRRERRGSLRRHEWRRHEPRRTAAALRRRDPSSDADRRRRLYRQHVQPRPGDPLVGVDEPALERPEVGSKARHVSRGLRPADCCVDRLRNRCCESARKPVRADGSVGRRR